MALLQFFEVLALPIIFRDFGYKGKSQSPFIKGHNTTLLGCGWVKA
jgi:hypothetical protein